MLPIVFLIIIFQLIENIGTYLGVLTTDLSHSHHNIPFLLASELVSIAIIAYDTSK
ncbi:hypothetical protein GGR58DRAFT_322480 [Xylaria digitata]|nr:hypothetical protein GGR58DRAFT_322480 [Xylaria digitata]